MRGNPKKTPPRVVTGPILLTGVAICAGCGSGMTLRTGKFNRYRYYACAGRAQKGPTKCEGCAVPMDGLDTLVLDQLADHVFRPDRLTDLLKGYLDRSQDAEHERRQRLGRLKAELTEVDGAIQQLLALRASATAAARRSSNQFLLLASAITSIGTGWISG